VDEFRYHFTSGDICKLIAYGGHELPHHGILIKKRVGITYVIFWTLLGDDGRIHVWREDFLKKISLIENTNVN
jgi:hypothetical protein